MILKNQSVGEVQNAVRNSFEDDIFFFFTFIMKQIVFFFSVSS